MCVGTYLPFLTTYHLNGHNWIENQLKEQGVAFHKDNNAFSVGGRSGRAAEGGR